MRILLLALLFAGSVIAQFYAWENTNIPHETDKIQVAESGKLFWIYDGDVFSSDDEGDSYYQIAETQSELNFSDIYVYGAENLFGYAFPNLYSYSVTENSWRLEHTFADSVTFYFTVLVNKCCIISSDKTLFITENYGEDWIEYSLPFAVDGECISMLDMQTLLFFAENNLIIYNLASGHYQSKEFPYNDHQAKPSLRILEGIIYANDPYSGFYSSTDTGDSWVKIRERLGGGFLIDSEDKFWLINRILQFSEDRGHLWKPGVTGIVEGVIRAYDFRYEPKYLYADGFKKSYTPEPQPNACNYVQLAIGNKWTYRDTYYSSRWEFDSIRVRQIIDTTTINNKLYFRYSDTDIMEAYQNNILYRYDPSKEEEYMQMDFNYFEGVNVTGKTRWGYDQIIVEQDIYILNGEEHFEKGYRSEEPQTYEKWISGVGQSKYYFQDAGWPYGTARSTLIDWDITNIMDATGTQTNLFLYLFQNFPNPFNPKTKITYSIARDLKVNLTVYDILGNKVTTLIDDFREAGLYDVVFNASHLPSGVYIYRVKAGGFSESKKMILLK